MKTNTFYNPKNQYNELLASVPYVNTKSAELESKLAAETDERNTAVHDLYNEIDTFNTIGVILVEEASLDNYFSKRLDEVGEETLKVELSRNVYILKNEELPNTYEEYIYKYASIPNGEVITKENPPTMIRLGAVDSIMAYDDRLGSVQLVHNIYETFEKLANGDVEAQDELRENFYEVNLDGEFIYHRPKKGKAAAPCALRSFFDADKEIIDSLELEIAARRDAIAAEETARTEESSAIKARLDKIEAEIEGSTVEDEIGFQDSRLDRIEAAIGMNHHCDNCGCEHTNCKCEDDKCSCSDAESKCTIYCRLNDIESDLDEHMNTLQSHNDRIEGLEILTEEHSTKIENLKLEDSAIRKHFSKEVNDLNGLIEGNVKRIDERLEAADTNIASNKTYIRAVEEHLEVEEARSKAADGQLRTDIDEEVEIRSELSDYVHHVLTENVNANTNEITKHEASIIVHETTLSSHKADIASLRNDLDDANNEIARQYTELTAEDTRLDASIKNNTANIDFIKNDITGRIDGELSKLGAVTSSNADKISHLELVDSEIKSTISEEKTKITNVQRDISINGAKITAVESKLNVLDEKTTTNAANINAHDTRIFNNTANIGALTDRVQTLENTTTTKKELDEVKATAAKNAEDIEEHSGNISELYSKASALDTSINSLDGKLDEKISEVNASISATEAALDNKITSLQTTVANNKTKSDSVANRVELLEHNIGTKNDDKTVREHISSLIEASAANESAIGALEVQTAGIENTIKSKIDTQTQFVVLTTLPASGVKSIPLSKIFEDEGASSSEWTIVSVTSVAKKNEDNSLEVIYPEIKYIGSDNTSLNGLDEREIYISFASGKAEMLQISISAFKESNKRIKNIA